jgi:NAD-dependent dihydropyrimidine dehydrogenase PreA subunit
MNCYVITGLCVGVKDRACVPACPVDCIYEGEQQLYIKPGECICCAACVPECPVQAIFMDDDVPEKHRDSVRENAAFFLNGLPGSGIPANP